MTRETSAAAIGILGLIGNVSSGILYFQSLPPGDPGKFKSAKMLLIMGFQLETPSRGPSQHVFHPAALRHCILLEPP
jgi:hypothetical protein